MTIAVDFDGTIVEHEYPKIGRPIPFAIETLRELQKDGHFLILWTVREGALLEEAVEYCRTRNVEFYAINETYPGERSEENYSRKLTVDLFIDDRNLGGMHDWGVIYQMIKEDQPFTPYDFSNTVSQRRSRENKNIFLRIGEAIEKAKNMK